MPGAHPERNPERRIRPDQQDQGNAIDGTVLFAGKDLGAPFDGRRKGFGNDHIIENEGASFPGEQGAQGVFEESLPRPIVLQNPC